MGLLRRWDWQILAALLLAILLVVVVVQRPWQQRPLRDTWDVGADVLDVAVSADGQYLAASDDASGIRLWRIGVEQPLRTIALPDSNVATSLAFSPDGRFLAAATDSRVIIWQSDSGSLERELPGPFRYLAFSPDGRKLTVSGGGLLTWQVEDWKVIAKLSDAIRHVVYSPDGRFLAGSIRSEIVIWDAKTMEKRRTLQGHQSFVTAITFSPDSAILASASGSSEIQDGVVMLDSDITVRLWTLDSPQPVKKLDLPYRINDITFSIDGRYLAIAGGIDDPDPPAHPLRRRILRPHRDLSLRVWGIDQGSIATVYQGHKASTNAVVWHPKDHTIVTGSADQTIRFWKNPE